MKKNLTKIFLGIAVVAAGVIFLGSAFGFWSLESLSGWWTVLIIAPAIFFVNIVCTISYYSIKIGIIHPFTLKHFNRVLLCTRE